MRSSWHCGPREATSTRQPFACASRRTDCGRPSKAFQNSSNTSQARSSGNETLANRWSTLLAKLRVQHDASHRRNSAREYITNGRVEDDKLVIDIDPMPTKEQAERRNEIHRLALENVREAGSGRGRAANVPRFISPAFWEPVKKAPSGASVAPLIKLEGLMTKSVHKGDRPTSQCFDWQRTIF